jgi:hypothetical protein
MPERGVLSLNRPHNVTAEFSDPRCTICDLVGMTSQQVRWSDDEDRGYDAEGESINAVEHWMALDHLREDPSFLDHCNSVLETRATSHWEPLVLVRTPNFGMLIRVFPTGLDAWRGAGIGTNAAGELVWNEEDHTDPVTEGA